MELQNKGNETFKGLPKEFEGKAGREKDLEVHHPGPGVFYTPKNRLSALCSTLSLAEIQERAEIRPLTSPHVSSYPVNRTFSANQGD